MALRADFNQADLERFFDENQVDEVECLVPDLTGVARGKILPRTKFTQDRGMRLAESVLAMTVTGEAPDSEEYGFATVNRDGSPKPAFCAIALARRAPRPAGCKR